MKIKQLYGLNAINYLWIVLLILSGIISSCKKEIVLPRASQNGSNTMGAYVDNNLWVPKLAFGGVGIDAECSPPFFYIKGTAQDPSGNSKTSVTIYILNFNGAGNYNLNANPNGTTGNTAECTRGSYTNYNYTNYITDNLHQGSITITRFDPDKHIVSGTFQLKLVNEHNSSDLLNVSSGRFDVTYPLTELN